MDNIQRSEEHKRRRRGRASVMVLIALVAIVAGGVGGYVLAKRVTSQAGGTTAGGAATAGGSATADGDQWYTCGMHPNVLQKSPGDCPICQMKLTPLKKNDDSDSRGGPSLERKVLYWRAPMDPNYISQKPGKSPMGMDLVPVYADAEDSASAHTIRIDPVTIQNMGIRTAVVQRGPLIKTIRTVGRVDYDEQLVTFVDTKFSGWIEELNVDETGQRVAKGQQLFGVYSPELYAAQQEYLSAIQNLPRLKESTFAPAREEAVKLVDAAVTKLKYFDVPDEQIEGLRESGKIEKTLGIHSPAGGIVTEKMALEGMYVQPGMRLYTIADLSRVWVYLDVYEYQLPWIRVGQHATMSLSYVPGEEFVGTVVYIYPYLEPRTRVIKVRLEFENPHMALKPGMFASVRLESDLHRDAILLPREAYIDSGTRQVTFVDLGNGKFAPRDIQVGVEAEDGMVEVLYGLDDGEVVVTSGQFMLDAESKLKEAVAKMMEAERAKTTKRTPPPDAHAGHDHGKMAVADAMAMPPGTTHACPMEAHPDETDPADQGPYFADAPGKCPRCGMKVKPLDALSWTKKYRPGRATAAVSADGGMPTDAKYACPMETHPDEADPANQGPYFANNPGKCPRCGMKLKPIDDLDWVQARRAADGGDVAYTCPDHQHVFSDTVGECPRCGKPLSPFKVMYSCPNPEHADVISRSPGNCPHCGRGMAAFRGVWLDEAMANANLPTSPGLAQTAPYQCPTHPLVHSGKPGKCTICGAELERTSAASEPAPVQTAAVDGAAYVCPMHPDQQRSAQPGVCSICDMQLVRKSALNRPQAAPEHVAAQMNYILEHYLELQRLLAADRTTHLTLHALGLVSASETLSKHIADPGMDLPPEAVEAAKRLHAAALKITGKLDADRVTFVELSAAVTTLVEHARPDRKRWPKLYLYHCPMSKGDWLQPAEEKSNPYYGFKMLNCGELKGVR
ncbi:MAG: efflux RND transporter periplasmic adaptor subunit [Phycisphaerae bacterium]